MRIKEIYHNTFTFKIVSFLFSDNFTLPFEQTLIGKLLKKIKQPKIALVLFISSVGLLWYEGALEKYIAFSWFAYLPSALLLLAFIFTDKNKIILRKYHFWYFSLLVLSAISTLFAVGRGVPTQMLFVGFYIFFQFGLVMLFGLTVKRTVIIRSLIYLGIPMAVFSIFQFFAATANPLWLSSFEELGVRSFGFFGSPNVLGLVMALLVLVSLFSFYQKKEKQDLFFASIFAIVLLLTFSRSSWLSLFVALIVCLFILIPKKAVYALPIPLIFLLIPRVRNRIVAAFNPQYIFDSYLDGRIWSAINAWFLAKKYPFIGAGPGSYGGKTALSNSSPVYLEGIQNGYTALYFSDNQYLQILVQLGFIGAFLFLGFFISVASSLYGRFSSKKDYYALLSLGVMIIIVTGSLFANVLEFSAISVPAAALIGMVGDYENK